MSRPELVGRVLERMRLEAQSSEAVNRTKGATARPVSNSASAPGRERAVTRSARRRPAALRRCLARALARWRSGVGT